MAPIAFLSVTADLRDDDEPTMAGAVAGAGAS
jgi:hypothetical protein